MVLLSQDLFILVLTSIPLVTPTALSFKPGEARLVEGLLGGSPGREGVPTQPQFVGDTPNTVSRASFY